MYRFFNVMNRQTPRKKRRDDRTGACAGDQIEYIGKDEFLIVLFLPKQFFNPGENLQ